MTSARPALCPCFHADVRFGLDVLTFATAGVCLSGSASSPYGSLMGLYGKPGIAIPKIVANKTRNKAAVSNNMPIPYNPLGHPLLMAL